MAGGGILRIVLALVLFLALPLLRCTPFAEGNTNTVSASVSKAADGITDIVTLQNSASRFDFIPAKSGVCSFLGVKDKGCSLTLQEKPELLREVFTHAAMQQGGKDIPFQYKLLKDQPDRVSVEFSAALDPANSDEAVAGCRFSKLVTLYAGRRYLEVQQTLTNATGDVVGAQVGVRQRFFLDAVKDQDTFYLPTERNILKIVAGGIDHFYAKMEDWEYHPVEGWMGAINPKSGAGVVFVMDSGSLDGYYTHNASGTSGWFVDGGIIEPGAAFTTAYTMIPVCGFHGLSHVSRRLIADIQAKAIGGGLEITHTIAGATVPLGDILINTSVMGARSKKEMVLPVITVQKVGVDPVEAKVMLNEPQEEPLVIRVEAVGKDWKESYETYFEGEFKTTIYPGYPYTPEYRRPKKAQ